MKPLLNLLFACILILCVSCSPMSKDTYLEDYKAFIEEVGENSSKYNTVDWKNADEKFEKFKGEWRKQFEDEFIWSEELTLGKYEVQYNIYKYQESAGDIIANVFGSYKDLEQKVKHYAENEMSEDIDFLIKQAHEMGDSATEMLNTILNDLELDIDIDTN